MRNKKDMENVEVIIIGAGGHAKVVADIIKSSGNKIKGVLDDKYPVKKDFMGLPILGKIADYKKFKDCEFIIGIGDADIRMKIADELKDVKWHIAIHPSAVISCMNTKIEEGTAVMPNAVINPGSTIGKHCIVNSGAIIEHDNIIDNFVHISVGAKLAGNVRIGKKSWIGIGSTISNNIDICENCIIGAGGVVVKKIDESGTYVGVPVKKIK